MSVSLNIDVAGIEEIRAHYARAPAEISKIMLNTVVGCTLDAQQAVISHTPYGVGPRHIRDAITHEITGSGLEVTGRVFVKGIQPVVVNSIEYGSRPHWPPVNALVPWVMGKLGVSGAESRSVAFLVARAISIRGTPAFHMFEKGFAETASKRSARIAKARADVLALFR